MLYHITIFRLDDNYHSFKIQKYSFRLDMNAMRSIIPQSNMDISENIPRLNCERRYDLLLLRNLKSNLLDRQALKHLGFDTQDSTPIDSHQTQSR